MISPEIVERVRNETPIFDLISQTVELHRAGTIWKGLCPIHTEKTPSFTVSEKRNSYKCWGCGISGSPIDWMIEYRGLEFPDAVRDLAGRLNIYVDEVEPSVYKERERPRKKILPPRALPDKLADFGPGNFDQHTQLSTLRAYRRSTVEEAVRRKFVGFTETQWCVRDATGVNGERRLLNGGLYGGKIKAKNFTGSWGAWPLGCQELRPGHSALVCEGSPDFIVGLEVCLSGLKADPVGILGASNAIHPAAIPFFKRKRVLIAQHKDAAGEGAVGRWSSMLPESEIWVIRMPNYVDSDLNDWLMETGDPYEIAEQIENQYK